MTNNIKDENNRSFLPVCHYCGLPAIGYGRELNGWYWPVFVCDNHRGKITGFYFLGGTIIHESSD